MWLSTSFAMLTFLGTLRRSARLLWSRYRNILESICSKEKEACRSQWFASTISTALERKHWSSVMSVWRSSSWRMQNALMDSWTVCWRSTTAWETWSSKECLNYSALVSTWSVFPTLFSSNTSNTSPLLAAMISRISTWSVTNFNEPLCATIAVSLRYTSTLKNWRAWTAQNVRNCALRTSEYTSSSVSMSWSATTVVMAMWSVFRVRIIASF